MTTTMNSFGERVTKWESIKHPSNQNFMQTVFWTIWEKSDGKVTVGYKLDGNGKTWFLHGITKEEAIQKYL